MNKTSVESFNVLCRWEFHQEMLFQRPKIQKFSQGACPQSSLEGVVTFASWSLPHSPSKCPGLDPTMVLRAEDSRFDPNFNLNPNSIPITNSDPPLRLQKSYRVAYPCVFFYFLFFFLVGKPGTDCGEGL